MLERIGRLRRRRLWKSRTTLGKREERPAGKKTPSSSSFSCHKSLLRRRRPHLPSNQRTFQSLSPASRQPFLLGIWEKGGLDTVQYYYFFLSVVLFPPGTLLAGGGTFIAVGGPPSLPSCKKGGELDRMTSSKRMKEQLIHT